MGRRGGRRTGTALVINNNFSLKVPFSTSRTLYNTLYNIKNAIKSKYYKNVMKRD